MPIKKPPLSNGEIYHIVVRAVENLKLFREENDYFRMIHDLFEFNDENPVDWNHRRVFVPNKQMSPRMSPRTVLGQLPRGGDRKRKRELLVEILAFCLMPNHVHLLVRQVRNGGISKLMRKIGAGYGIYYNNKYKRRGHLFQGKYRIVHIKTDEQLKTVFVYIHTNPVSIIVPNWREKGIRDFKKVIKFLEKYRWSSYPDYLGLKNFPSLTNREFLTKIMGGIQGSRDFVMGWLQFKKRIS